MESDADSASTKMESESKPTEAAHHGGGDGNNVTGENLGNYGWITVLRDFFKEHRIDLALWIARLVSLFYFVFSLIPLFGPTYLNSRRVLMCNLITSGLRLYQRVPRPFVLGKENFMNLALEDSFHYLLYSLIFLYLGHISFCLVPIFLFASLHVASFTLQMAEAVYGPNAKCSGIGALCYGWKSRTGRLLKLVALAEVTLMGIILVNCLGKGLFALLTPFAYFRFLQFRYASRRNHFTRLVFYEMRVNTEKVVASGKCPALIAKVLTTGIWIVCKLSPIN